MKYDMIVFVPNKVIASTHYLGFSKSDFRLIHPGNGYHCIIVDTPTVCNEGGQTIFHVKSIQPVLATTSEIWRDKALLVFLIRQS